MGGDSLSLTGCSVPCYSAQLYCTVPYCIVDPGPKSGSDISLLGSWSFLYVFEDTALYPT